MQPTLLYDGDCRLCRFAARAVDRLDRDRRLALLPFDDPNAAPLFEQLPEGEHTASWQLFLADGRRVSRGAGIADVLQATRRAPRVVEVLRVLPLDRLYAYVARHRRMLGHVVPDGPAPRRC